MLGRADADVFAHAEGLQPVDIARRFAAETIASDIEQKPFRRNFAAARHDRIDRITGGRRQHEIGGAESVGPVLAGFEALDSASDVGFAAAKAADADEKMREAF